MLDALFGIIPCLGLLGVIILFLFFSAVKVVQEYERGVIFRLGRFVGAKGPGIFFIVPFIDRMMKVDLRTLADSRWQRHRRGHGESFRYNCAAW